jgi:hypothetical protein
LCVQAAKPNQLPVSIAQLFNPRVSDIRTRKNSIASVDLWCASRYLLHQAAAYTSTGAAGIGAPQLILAGTHTHAGPGNYFGNTLYDTIVSSDLSGFHKKTADAASVPYQYFFQLDTVV